MVFEWSLFILCSLEDIFAETIHPGLEKCFIHVISKSICSKSGAKRPRKKEGMIIELAKTSLKIICRGYTALRSSRAGCVPSTKMKEISTDFPQSKQR